MQKQSFFRPNSSTVVTIRGLKATEEGKPASVKVSFKVKKTGKASKYSYVSKVNVIDEKLTMTAAATKAKQITVTFSKAVDVATTKIVVKKGSSTPTATVSFDTDGKTATIAMGTKLTEGTYTVEATVGEEKLTADIAVQDEKLTKFELVAPVLIADPVTKTNGTVSYKALNQYDEMMPVDTISTTCTFGQPDTGNDKTPTADRAGVIAVKSIDAVLAVPGTSGTVTIVDTSTGVQLNEKITYQTKAVAAKATVYGIYDSKKEKLVESNLKTNEKVTNYWMLMNVQNQYDADMTVENIADSLCTLSYNVASVLTDLTLMEKDLKTGYSTMYHKDINYDGKSCVLVKIGVTQSVAGVATKSDSGKITTAGKMGLTMVSAEKGVIASPSFTVDDEVMIKSLSVSAKSAVYGNTDNELVVEAIDNDGNAVTKYDTLKAAVISGTSGLVLKKNTDGTGTFYYNPGSISADPDRKYKNYEPKTLIFKVNDPTSGNYFVKTITLNAYANQNGWKVAGTTDKTVTAVATGSALKLELKTLKFEDQYSNELDYTAGQIDLDQVSAYLVDKEQVFRTDATTGKQLTVTKTTSTDHYISLTPLKSKGSATLYLRYKNAAVVAGASEEVTTPKGEANPDKYDVKITLSAIDTMSLTADDITVTVNYGNAIYGVDKAQLNPALSNSTAAKSEVNDGAATFGVGVVVSAKIGGKTVILPTTQWTIVGGDTLGGYRKVANNTVLEKTEEKTVNVVVQTDDGPVTVSQKVTVSNAGSSAQKIKAVDGKDTNIVTGVSGTAITCNDLINVIEVKDQYGWELKSTKKNEMQYTVTFTGAGATDLQENCIKSNGTQAVAITLNGSGTTGDSKFARYTATVTFKLGSLEFTRDINIDVD